MAFPAILESSFGIVSYYPGHIFNEKYYLKFLL
jgi:hypothetical protein